MAVAHPVSYEKTLKQLAVVATKPFTVNGQQYIPPGILKLSPTFWRKYGCHLNCGACCPLFSLDYIPDEWEKISNARLKQGATSVSIKVNGERKTIFSYMPVKPRRRFDKEWCDFVDFESGICTVHNDNPLSCRIELIKFRMVKGNGYIGKQPYGRAWTMKRATDGVKKVLCDFGQFDREQFENNDLPILRQINAWADYLGISTHLPRIIGMLSLYVEEGDRHTFMIKNT